MNLTREQVCLSILTKIGFLFERRHMLVDQDNYGRRHCSDALMCTPHLVCTLLILQDMRMWVQQHHFSVSLYVFRPYSSTPPTKSLGTFGKQNIYWSKRKKKHIDKMTPNDILTYSKINSFLNHHQRSFLLQQIGTNTETHSQTLHRE